MGGACALCWCGLFTWVAPVYRNFVGVAAPSHFGFSPPILLIRQAPFELMWQGWRSEWRLLQAGVKMSAAMDVEDLSARPSASDNGSEARNKRRRKKKKKKRSKVQPTTSSEAVHVKKENGAEEEQKLKIEYVSEVDTEAIESNPEYAAYAMVFKHFMSAEEMFAAQNNDDEEAEDGETVGEGKSESIVEGGKQKQKKKPTKRERKVLKRERVAVLKQLVEKPEVVEVHDVNSADPGLLVHLKSLRNTVPVPRHWSQRRKYLQGKRGLEKVAFELPEFIAATGIATIRQAVADKAEEQSSKQKQRERVTGKMGKIDIDYQVLYDAFFRHQTKPKLTRFGDIYYEGKEFEVSMRERKPGIMSRELREALGMGEMAPPPWLVNMQRNGPPPSYPKMRIPGLNAPLPPGASYGYHPGGWGKPPVDENNRPLYGDVFGVNQVVAAPAPEFTAAKEMKTWGEMEEVEEEESSDEEDDGGEVAPGQENGGDETARERVSAADIDGVSSYSGGLETPETMTLRKEQLPAESPQPLYQVLPQVSTGVSAGMYGSSHKYVMPGQSGPEKVELFKSQKTEKMDVTLNPTDFGESEGLTEDLIRRKYQEQIEAEKQNRQKEDVSDIIAAHSRKRKASAPLPGDDARAKKFKF